MLDQIDHERARPQQKKLIFVSFRTLNLDLKINEIRLFYKIRYTLTIL